jgi:hypothetical protein
VVLITASGPGGQVDVGVRADATPAELAGSLGALIGVSDGWSSVEHHAPPRPGVPQGTRVRLADRASLADGGVADGDLLIFRRAVSAVGGLASADRTSGAGKHSSGSSLQKIEHGESAGSDESDDRR